MVFNFINSSILPSISRIIRIILNILLFSVIHKPIMPRIFIIISGIIRFLSLFINVLLTCVLSSLAICSLLVPSIVLVVKSLMIILNSLLLSSFSNSSIAFIKYSFIKHNAIFCVSLLTLNDSLFIIIFDSRFSKFISSSNIDSCFLNNIPAFCLSPLHWINSVL